MAIAITTAMIIFPAFELAGTAVSDNGVGIVISSCIMGAPFLTVNLVSQHKIDEQGCSDEVGRKSLANLELRVRGKLWGREGRELLSRAVVLSSRMLTNYLSGTTTRGSQSYR